MTGDLGPYSEMRDSGVSWLGALPAHWKVLPARAIFVEVKERDRPNEEMLSVTIKRGVVPQRTLLLDSSRKDGSNLDKSAYKRVRPGDIAYNKMRAWQGAVGISIYEGIVSPAYVVERPREGADPKYLHHLLRTPAFATEARRWSFGITSDMWSLRPEHFKLIYACLPPLSEQAAIVGFLDHVDHRIRRYVAAKKALIALLNEQQQAIIHRAVTRGLNPNVRLKPTGVEWLENVPEHWDVRRLGACLKSVTGLWGDDPSDDNRLDHIVCVRVADFDMDRLEVSDRRLTNRALSQRARESRSLLPGDLLMEKSGGGDAEPVGRVVRFSLPQPAVCSNFVARLRPLPAIVRSEYLLYVLALLQSTRRNVPSIKQTTGIQNLDMRHYFSNSIAVPPLDEQDAILGAVNASLATLRRAKELAASEIGVVREFHTRLIADVVTGKIDVREAAARLPDEAREPAILEGQDAFSDEDGSVVDEDPAIASGAVELW